MKEQPPNPALDEFVRDMQALRDRCGGPSLRKLQRLSRKVVELYGERYPNLVELSLASLSDVLGRRRLRPPSWPWLACYVLACQQYARQSGLPTQGEVELPSWNRRLQAVRAGRTLPPAAEGAHLPAAGGRDDGVEGALGAENPGSPGGGALDADDVPPPGGLPLPAPVGPRPAPGGGRSGEARRHEPMRRDPAGGPAAVLPTHAAVAQLLSQVGEPGISMAERRFFTCYGQHGVRLFRDAERGSAECAYRLGVLLCIDDKPTESLAWLMQAEARGHRQATALIEQASPMRLARAHAYAIGRRAAGLYDDPIADLYLEKAATAGHAGAAYGLGQLWLRREDAARAEYWFSRAREAADPDGSDIPMPGPVIEPAGPPARPIRVPSLAELLRRVAHDR